MTGDRSASLRLLAHTEEALNKLQQGEELLSNQWNLEKVDYRSDRSGQGSDVDPSVMFAHSPGEWTEVQTPANGDLYFFHLKEKQSGGSDLTALYDELHQAHAVMSDDAQRNYMQQIVQLFKEHHAISLDYLNNGEDSMEANNP